MKKQLESLVREMVENGIRFDQARDEFEREFIQTALARSDGNRSRAARLLGVHRNTLNRRIQQLRLNGTPRS